MGNVLGHINFWSHRNRPAAQAKQKLQFRDPDDPRLLYKISDRAKRISLKINPSDREVIVTVPGQRSYEKARRFAFEKMDWINVQLEGLPPAQPFTPGAGILFKGEIYELHCPGPRGRPQVDAVNKRLIVPGHADTFAGRVQRLLIREARAELEHATGHYADILGREVAKVSVRDTRSRWGSCITRAGKGHISYSWRLVCAPSFVLNYVAAHECAHMIEDNHSAAFWAVTERIFPETKKAKAWLRKNGAFLHAVGADF